MNNVRSVFRSSFILFFGLLVVCSCKDDSVSPGVGLEVTNVVDNFQYQVSDMKNYSQTIQYSWRNTGTIANVNQACAITAGTAMLTIRDSTGTQLYSKNLAENGSFVTSGGAAGNWTIQLSLSSVSGTLNFRVQKRP